MGHANAKLAKGKAKMIVTIATVMADAHHVMDADRTLVAVAMATVAVITVMEKAASDALNAEAAVVVRSAEEED